MSGLFGELDATEVSDNPFYVAPDTYQCVLSEFDIVQSKSGEKTGLTMKWVIEDEDSEYVGNSISDWKTIYPGITADEVTPEIKKDLARLKSRLLEMGIPEDDMNNLTDEDVRSNYVGMVAFVEVTETKDKNDPDKTYTNVRKIRALDA